MNNSISGHDLIGSVVANDYRTASIFKNYGIDFCCNGNRTIATACANKSLNESEVLNALNNTNSQSDNSNIDFQSWPLDLLVDYIEKKHHRYVREKIEEITRYLSKIVKVHGSVHPELYEIDALFCASSSELKMHMAKEENILFPYVRTLMGSLNRSSHGVEPHFVKIETPIEVMMKEHNVEGERFRQISAQSNNYTPPEDACATYKLTYALLKEFESDLHLHIHLENNILFPRAIALESQLRTKTV